MKLKLLEKIDGYELEAEYTKLWIGDTGIDANGDPYLAPAGHMGIKLTPERKFVDWNKVDKDVLVHKSGGPLYRRGSYPYPHKIWEGFQAHMLNDQCPVDPDAFMVQVWYKDNSVGVLVASSVSWDRVTRYRVTGLADGYEYK